MLAVDTHHFRSESVFVPIYYKDLSINSNLIHLLYSMLRPKDKEKSETYLLREQKQQKDFPSVYNIWIPLTVTINPLYLRGYTLLSLRKIISTKIFSIPKSKKYIIRSQLLMYKNVFSTFFLVFFVLFCFCFWIPKKYPILHS